MAMKFYPKHMFFSGTRHLRKEGRENVEAEHRSGRPSTVKSDENVKRVRSLVATDRRLTVRFVANELNMNKNAVHQILTDHLDMRKVCAKMVPKNLTDEQKENRQNICQELPDCLETEPDFMDHVITGDESWVFEYDPETKRQSKEWHTNNSPRPKNVA
jgi:hypothetical protein